MTTIKIERDSLKDAATKVNIKVTSYQDKVVSSASTFSDISTTLSGKGYDTLLAQMNSKIGSQKKLVAECQILSDEIRNYASEMAYAESSASFPS
ncbi:hypothetical protein DOK67_0000940 [Enterococcus sp. DIV0212c]|uniref:hypothetical protein n=1 Tax=Enterococcus sp. DIV0212c TaxID=2230867 RepID=UPI001A9AEBF6|nr:hypothetical protein [Enterococcus sp. DIV0212c]MBO1352639.1 hypothetical protein [Enterococcus sp. DIV0212c]